MKLKTIVASLIIMTASMSVQAVTLTFVDGLGTDPYPGSANTSAFPVGAEFRFVSPQGAVTGGSPVNKSTINGDETWTFNNASALMTSVSGTAPTVGAPASPSAPNGGPGIDQGTNFLGVPFTVLAPAVGSAAGNYYGPSSFMFGGLGDGIANVGDTFSITAPTLEAQWAGSYLPLANIVFFGTITGSNGAFHLWAEHKITTAEDPSLIGLVDWTVQWNYQGNISALPVPEATTYGMMLAGLGLVSCMGVRRRNQTA